MARKPIGQGNTLPAFKTILFALDLSHSEKVVLGCIMDHQNHNTGRCDPSYDRVAYLTGFSESNVKKTVSRLSKTKEPLLIKKTHGGRYGTNAYGFNWAKLNEMMADHNRRQIRVPSLTNGPDGTPSTDTIGVKDGTLECPQTYSKPNKEPKGLGKRETDEKSGNKHTQLPKHKKSPAKEKEIPSLVSKGLSKRNWFQAQPTVDRSQIAHEKAKKRVDDAIRLKGKEIYELYISCIETSELEEAATLELKRTGAGVRYIAKLVYERGQGIHDHE